MRTKEENNIPKKETTLEGRKQCFKEKNNV